MALMAKLVGQKKLIEVMISFYKSGEINVKLVYHSDGLTNLDLLELFCYFYIDILHNIGKTPVCDRIIKSFDSIAKAYSIGENVNIDLSEIARSIGKLVELPFDILERFRIQRFRIVTNKTDKPSATYRIELVENRNKQRYIQTHYGAWMSKLYVPLSLFSLFSHINELFIRKDDELQALFMFYINSLHSTEWIKAYGNLTGMMALSNFTEAFFKNRP